MGNQASGGWTIRYAQPGDYRAARILLPQAVHFGSGSAVWIGESSADHRIIAAAALSPRLRADPVAGARLAIHVIEPWRRRGIARAMIELTEKVALQFKAAALFAWNPVEQNSEALRSWQSLGFVHSTATQVGIVELARAENYVQPMFEQLIEHNWIPSEAKIIPVRQADHAQIAKLHAKYLGGTAQQIIWRMTGQMPDPYDLDLSPALLFNGEVKAFTLVRVEEKNCHVDATVVDPALRGGWANLWLKHESIRWMKTAGIKTMSFQTHDRHTDTRKFCKKSGGVTRHFIEPYRLIAAGATVASPTAPAAQAVDAPAPQSDRPLS